MALALSAVLAACGGGSGGGGGGGVAPMGGGGATVLPGAVGSAGAATSNPTVLSASPSNNATNVPTITVSTGNVTSGTLVTATFSQAMKPLTITTAGTFTLKATTSGANVTGVVTINAADTVATFTPSAALAANTGYTATVSTAAQNTAGTPMPSAVQWAFTTAGAGSTGVAAVNLGTAGNFVILAETMVTDVFPSVITGNVGLSPASGAAIGLTCAEVTGTIYSTDAAGPLPCRVTSSGALTTAVADMTTAYNNASVPLLGPAVGATNLNVGGGTLGTQTFTPGLYTWTSNVGISAASTITLAGGPDDVWIFQVQGTLSESATANMVLSGGAKAKNVFWIVQTAATIGASPAHFEGVILAGTAINFGAGSSANSRFLAQSAVNLISTTLVQPAP
jgi:hypothetical protein